MNFRTTLYLLLATAVIGGAIVAVERYLPSTRELRDLRSGPMGFSLPEVDRVLARAAGQPDLALERRGPVWSVVSPFEDHANPEKIETLLTDLTAVEWVERVQRDEFDDAAWQQTGLDDTRLSLELWSGEDRVAGCEFGLASVLDGSVYIKIPQTEDGGYAYYVGRTDVPAMFLSGAADWRDPKLVRLPEESIKRLTLSQASGQIELSRETARSPWELAKPLATRGDQDRIDEVVSTLLNLAIRDVSEAAAEETTAVTQTELKVSLDIAGMEGPLEVTLEKPDEEAQVCAARTSQRSPRFTVESESLASLWAMPNDLRDPMLARVQEEDVASIEISSLKNPTVFMEKKSGAWLLERQGQMIGANGDRLAQLFSALSEHRIVEFASDSASNLEVFGLHDPFLSLKWRKTQGQEEALRFGASKERTGFYAKYDSDPFVYRVGASLLPSIPSDPVKWMGLGVLRFSQFALRGIVIAPGAQSPLTLGYDPETAEWSASRGGRDITNMIDRVRADSLANKLARLTVEDWAGDRTEGYKALKDPWLTILVELGEPGSSSGPTETTTLRFAPTVKDRETAFFFGRVNDDPDVFYMTRRDLLEVLTSVFRDGAGFTEP
jgi:hypothetical protein